ncbi:hypothetical protein MAR_035821, partial [Mya arenaria]
MMGSERLKRYLRHFLVRCDPEWLSGSYLNRRQIIWRNTKYKTPEYGNLRISETCITAQVKRIITSFMYHIGHSKNQCLSDKVCK